MPPHTWIQPSLTQSGLRADVRRPFLSERQDGIIHRLSEQRFSYMRGHQDP